MPRKTKEENEVPDVEVSEDVVVNEVAVKRERKVYKGQLIDYKNFPAVVSVVNENDTVDLFVFREYNNYVKNVSQDELDNE